jgi:pantoate--beta-alanine ligase
MQYVETIAELRAACERARARGDRVGLVPTMGYLHEGHRSLIRAARAATDLVVVTIFVNPLQFGAHEDLDRYPRDLSSDLDGCEAEGADLVFAPSRQEMYPDGAPLATVHVERLTEGLCGAVRPTHFDGVTTVVTKLFAITGPCTAFFGRKDAQQLAVITRMVADLNLPVEVVGCPLVREPDGLAMSSRNAYLSPEVRVAALVLSRALETAADAVIAGVRDAGATVAAAARVVAAEPRVEVEYLELRHASDLTPCTGNIEGDVLLAVAARVGETRLIDNVTLCVRGAEASADLGIRSNPGDAAEPGMAERGNHVEGAICNAP